MPWILYNIITHVKYHLSRFVNSLPNSMSASSCETTMSTRCAALQSWPQSASEAVFQRRFFYQWKLERFIPKQCHCRRNCYPVLAFVRWAKQGCRSVFWAIAGSSRHRSGKVGPRQWVLQEIVVIDCLMCLRPYCGRAWCCLGRQQFVEIAQGAEHS